MLSSTQLRLRRKARQRHKIRQTATTGRMRLCVHRTNLHTYAQIIDDVNAKTLITVSTLTKEARSALKNGGNKEAAIYVGQVIAKAAAEKGITEVVFDRSGFLYHGRIKALADSAREHGLKF
jgi:large subunit ribosomal protein L18